MRKERFIVFLLILLPIMCFAQWDKYFENTGLRIDYTHSGHVGVDYFTIEAMKEIPYYSGSHTNLIDKTNNGAYLISLYDKTNNKLVYSKGVSSLYNEWLSMDEAKTTCGNFEEVVIVPMPKRDVQLQITFSIRDSLNHWKEISRQEINTDDILPLQHMFSKAKPARVDTIILNHTGKKISQRVDLVLVPVGYTQNDKQKMMQDLQKMTSYMFAEEPYKSKKNDIEIIGLIRYAEESGIGGLEDSKIKNSDLGVVYNTFSSPRYLMTRELWALYDEVDLLPCDAMILVCNSDTYGGGGIYNYYATCYMGTKSKEVIVHEFSHSFCGLGDEYADNDSQAGMSSPTAEPYEKNVTTLVDFSSKWSDMIEKNTPIPTPATKDYADKVGVFEGASYQAKGFYRPYLHCMMRDLYPFCPVCTKAINEIIDIYSK